MVQPVVTLYRSIDLSLGSYGGLKLEVVHDFSRKVAFLKKTTHYGEIFNILF